MAKARISTGVNGLDADLRKLQEVLDSGKDQEIKRAITDYSLTAEQLFETVPRAIYRLTLGLRNPRLFKALMDEVPKEVKPQLEDARRIIEERFADLLKHPAVIPTFAEAGESHESSTDHLNEITEVSHIPGWTGTPPRMQPFSRLVFLGKKGRPLLDSACDWDDLLYLGESIVGMLACEMKGGKHLAELKLVELPKARKISMNKRIRGLEENLAKIKRYARLYGLESDGDPADEASEG